MAIPAGRPILFDFSGMLRMLWALSLLVFLRRDLGLRLLHWRQFVITAVLVIAFFRYFEGRFDIPITLFAGTAAALAVVHAFRHAVKIYNGNPGWHTWSVGRSTIFSFVPLPAMLVCGLLEPLACFALGWWLSGRPDTLYLGWWIMGSAIMLFLIERTVRLNVRERFLDLADTNLEAEGFALIAAIFAEQAAKHAQRWKAYRRRRRTASGSARRQRAGQAGHAGDAGREHRHDRQ
jgi:hypothetical protein